MMRHKVTIAGLALGALYLIEAVISTGIFFALWPILGGVFAASLAGWDRRVALTARVGARAGAQAGVLAGMVLLIVGTPLTYYLLQQLGEKPGFFGRTFDLGLLPTLLIMFALYALFGILVAAAAGAGTSLLRGGVLSRRD